MRTEPSRIFRSCHRDCTLPAGFQGKPRLRQFGGNFVGIGKYRPILSGKDLVGQSFQGIMGHGGILPGAQDQTNGRVFTFARP